jgi:hypothetical protein
MDKTRRGILEKLDRILLFLTLERIDARTQKEWEDFHLAALTVRNVRKEVAHASKLEHAGVV